MQEIIQSLSNVTSATGFWFYMGGVVSLGMVIGNKYDESYNGFRKSIFLLSPYFIILFITTVSRITEMSLTRPLSSTAFNGLITLLIVTFFYVLGLFIGHVIMQKAHEKVVKEAHDTF